MKNPVRLIGLTLLLAGSNVAADTHYVSLASTNPTPPYTNSATAATNIQAAVNAASWGDVVWVLTDGVYPGGLSVPGGVMVMGSPTRGVIIDGGGAVRCASLDSGASLWGLTLTNGACYGNGAGVVCTSTSAGLTNCTLSGNMARAESMESGGCGGGVYLGTLSNCTLSGNTAVLLGGFGYGGGAYGSVLYKCTLSGNWGGRGGGANSCTLYNCTLTGNAALKGQGGGAYDSTLYDCTLTDNRTEVWGGGAASCTLYNCTLRGNRADGYWSPITSTDGYGGGVASCTLYNCTLTGNHASGHYPERTGYGGGAVGGALYNCIVYANTAPNGADYYETSLSYCWTDSAPLFVDDTGGNLRLQSNSPCINAGNNAFVSVGADLDGSPRVVSGTVDIGAYEYQGAGSIISYAWLQRYGLPTDGSADNLDCDGDGHNNWQEWRCDTCPTNCLSALRLLSAVPAGSNVTVSWQSSAGVDYFLKRSTNLASTFAVLATNIVGQAGTTAYADTNGTGPGPFFYRVGVNAP